MSATKGRHVRFSRRVCMNVDCALFRRPKAYTVTRCPKCDGPLKRARVADFGGEE